MTENKFTGFKIISLKKMLELLGEDTVKRILSEFLCPLNLDVERFLHTKAIEFSKQGWAQTHLVYGSYRKEPVLLGYFTLSDKYINIYPNKYISNTTLRRVRSFARHDKELGCYFMSAPLIGQLGKNFRNGYDKLISGDELLNIACNKIKQIQVDLGGKFTYLECEDKPVLVDFYMRNGFYNFGKRYLDKEETDDFEKNYLIQLLKYLK